MDKKININVKGSIKNSIFSFGDHNIIHKHIFEIYEEKGLGFNSASELLEFSESASNEGYFNLSNSILMKLYTEFRPNQPSKKELELLSKIYLFLGNVQMQLGNNFIGETSSYHLALKCLKLFNDLNDPYGIAKTNQLIGLSYRQINHYEKALQHYEIAYKIISDKKEHLSEAMHIYHDMSVSSFLLGKKIEKDELFIKAEKLANKANEVFSIENPFFLNIALIRKAEMYIKNNCPTKSFEILDQYEDVLKYLELSLPFQSLFLRINAEKYLAVDELDKAKNYFSKAVELNSKEGYHHQMLELKKLKFYYKEKLRDFSHKEFNVD